MISKVIVYPDAGCLARGCAENFTALAEESIKTRGKFIVSLAGGSTPRQMYTLLASNEFTGRINWAKVHVFWSDERCVPPLNKESNYRIAIETLLSKVEIPSENIHRIMSEHPPDQAAKEYRETLREVFGLNNKTLLPRFDLVLLGMGEDGHTASLFPGSDVIKEKKLLVAAPYIEKLKSHRITLTLPVLTNALNIVFIISGSRKAEILQKVLEDPFQPLKYPVQLLIYSTNKVSMLVDKAATGKFK